MPNVLILGAGSDLGQALAHDFAKKSHSVWIAGRDKEFLSSFSKDLNIRYSIDAKDFYFNSDDFSEHSSFCENLPQIPDIVIYLIGYMGSATPLTSEWKETIKVLNSNYIGAVSILNLLAQKMMSRKSGTIIGVSSVAGERGRQSNYLYGSAKAGFTSYLSGLRNALFPFGIQVITVKPGFMRTKMTEGLKLSPFLTAEPEKASQDIYNAYIKAKDVIYTKPIWSLIMMIIRNIPEKIFKKLTL